MVVDFDAHDQDYLRDEFAHRHLGFAFQEIEGYLAEAGLVGIRSERVAPARGEAGKLTVALWIAEDLRVVSDPFPKSDGVRLMAVKSVPLSRSGARIRVSFEFFPPKTAEMEANLWEAATRLEPLNPSFVSVTYGAGGSTRERTHATVQRFVRETTIKPAAHLNWVGASRNEDSPDLARLSRRRRAPYRGAARRSADRLRRPLCSGARRLSNDRRPRRRCEGEAISRSRSKPIRKSTRKARRCCTTSSF